MIVINSFLWYDILSVDWFVGTLKTIKSHKMECQLKNKAAGDDCFHGLRKIAKCCLKKKTRERCNSTVTVVFCDKCSFSIH